MNAGVVHAIPVAMAPPRLPQPVYIENAGRTAWFVGMTVICALLSLPIGLGAYVIVEGHLGGPAGAIEFSRGCLPGSIPTPTGTEIASYLWLMFGPPLIGALLILALARIHLLAAVLTSAVLPACVVALCTYRFVDDPSRWWLVVATVLGLWVTYCLSALSWARAETVDPLSL